MIAGAFEFIDIPRDSPERDAAVMHFMVMCSAWLIFLFALALHGYPPKIPVSPVALLTTALGFFTMVFGARLGGKLVYEFGVGTKAAR
jgi:uncharacterized membrane protein